MRPWLAIAFLVLTVAAAVAMDPAQQIIMFGGQSSASNPPPVTCGTGVIDLSTGCTLPIALGLIP